MYCVSIQQVLSGKLALEKDRNVFSTVIVSQQKVFDCHHISCTIRIFRQIMSI